MQTHNTLDYENRSIIDLYGLTSSDPIFMPSPLAHITGVLYGIHLPLMLGSYVVLQDVWQPDAAVELIARYRCGFMLAATPFLLGLVNTPRQDRATLSSLRMFGCGGADVPPDLIREASKEIDCHVTRVYGSTEFPTATSCPPADPLDKCAETDGRAIGRAQVRVVDDNGSPVTAGDPGEVLVRGPELFLAYADTTLNTDFRDDGWFATGDLGVLDDAGYLTIVGREKDIIIRRGENISAKEIEDQLFNHPAISDVAVVGYPDSVMGEKVAVMIVPVDKVALDLPDIVEWLEGSQIAGQKMPERRFIMDALPRTASGKIQKYILRKHAVERI